MAEKRSFFDVVPEGRPWEKSDFTFPPDTEFVDFDGRPVAWVTEDEAWEFTDPEALEPMPPGFAFSEEAGFITFDQFVRLVNAASTGE